MTFAQRSAADHAADAEFITAVRGGDTSAYAALYERHRAAAYHLARQLTSSPSEADDLVSDAFTKVFHTLLAGGGPDSAFRAYLLTSVRNTFYDGVRRGKKVTYTDDMEPHDEGQPFHDTAVAGLDSAMAARAFAKLPERWQTVLWHTEIEGESPAQVAPILGLTANAAAALAYRAREGLRQAFLQEHIADVADSDCKITTDRLGAWARGGLSKRELAQVERHLDDCDRCAAVAAEINDLGAGLRGVVAVLAIGTAPLTAAYLAGGSSAKLAALAWAGAGAPAAGFAKVSGLISATSPATTSTATAGAFVSGAGSSSASASGAARAAKNTTRGLIGAVAGTAAVAAIATAVIVGTSYNDPKPSAKDGGLATSAAASANPPAGSKPGTNPAPPAAPSATDPYVSGGSNRTPYTGDIADLPAIPPVISESIPGADPTIPALPSTTPPAPQAPQPTNPGTQPPTNTGNPGTSTGPSSTTENPTTTEPTSPVTNLTTYRETLNLLDSSKAVVSFVITNPGKPEDATPYIAPTLTIDKLVGLGPSQGPSSGTPSNCTVYVKDLDATTPVEIDGEIPCGDKKAKFTLPDLAPGTSMVVTVHIDLRDDLAGVVSSIPMTFGTGEHTVVFTATPTALAPLEAPGNTTSSSSTSASTTPGP